MNGGEKLDLKKVNQELNTYIRPGTFPIAVKMVDSEKDVPEKARKPKEHLGAPMPVCQGLALARRYGWLIAMGREDMLCPLGALTLGFESKKPKFLDGSFNIPFWVKNQKIRAKMSQYLPQLEEGRYTHLIATPIHRADFEPQVIIIYGNPAQISRLVQARVYGTGEPVDSSSAGGFACGLEITAPILTDECQIVLVGGGDRAIAQADDHEAAFAVPMSKVDDLLEGLEKTHEAGMRYPTTSFLMYEAQFPPSFGELMDYLRKGD